MHVCMHVYVCVRLYALNSRKGLFALRENNKRKYENCFFFLVQATCEKKAHILHVFDSNTRKVAIGQRKGGWLDIARDS